MPVDTDPGPPEERTLDSDVLSGRSKKKARLKMFGIQQIWTAKGDSLLGGRSSLDDSTARNLGQLLLVLQKRSLSESLSESWSFVFV